LGKHAIDPGDDVGPRSEIRAQAQRRDGQPRETNRPTSASRNR
jgi:hypothetical protein